MPGVCVNLCAPGLKIWPEFKRLHQSTGARGFGVDCFADRFSFTTSVICLKTQQSFKFHTVLQKDLLPVLTWWNTMLNAV